MANFLITGGAEFIGSDVAEYVLTHGHRITLIDDLNDFYHPQLKRDNLTGIGQSGSVRFLSAFEISAYVSAQRQVILGYSLATTFGDEVAGFGRWRNRPKDTLAINSRRTRS